MVRGAAFAVIVAAAGPCAAADLVGQATVIDGNTIEIHSQRVRLFGIDSPESGQTCKDGRKVYRCGQEAAFALSDLIGWQTVSCDRRDTDRYGRVVAFCAVAGEDLGGWMVRRGLAVAYRRYSLDYVEDEEVAKRYAQGVWRGEFVMPWDWRKGVR